MLETTLVALVLVICLVLAIALFVFLSTKQLSKTEFAFWGGVGMAMISGIFRAGIFTIPTLKDQIGPCYPIWALIALRILGGVAFVATFPAWALIIRFALWIIEKVQRQVRRGSFRS